MNKDKKKIIYFYTIPRSFIKNDIKHMADTYNIEIYEFNDKSNIQLIISFFKQFFWCLFNLKEYDGIFIFFAGYHSIIPVLISNFYKIKSIIFLGGADCYSYPSFNYGHYSKTLIAKANCLSVKNSSLLIPVHESLIYSKSKYYIESESEQGIRHFCKGLRTPIETIYLEYDHDFFKPISDKINNKSFITAGFGLTGSTFVRKGIDIILEAALQCPDYSFTILGADPKELDISIPTNVQFLPPIPYDELANLYAQHRFYLQLSIAEGFPSAICEAMLCGCIPIGSDVAAIPKIIGDSGYILFKRDTSLLIKLLHTAVSNDDKNFFPRKQIMANFGINTRKIKLLETISNYGF